MSIVPTTLFALLALLILLWQGPRRGLWALFCATPFGAAAAINLPAVGGASILLADAVAVFYLGVVILIAGNFRHMLVLASPPKPAFYLLCMVGISLIVTIFAPRLFQGVVDVFSIARDDRDGILLTKLRPNPGNITQMLRLTLSVSAFFAVATVFRRNPDTRPILTAFIAASTINVILGVVDWVSYNVGYPQLMDPLRTANYAMAVNQIMAGMKRMVGGYPEASAFGYYTLGLFGFWFQYWLGGGKNKLGLPMLIITALVLFFSASSSAYAAILIFLFLVVVLNALRKANRHVSPRTVMVLSFVAIFTPVVVCVLVMAYQLDPEISAYFDRVLFDKLEGDSAAERTSWNMQAIQNTFDTYGFGAGLGSVRASNFVIATISSIGVLGALFYFLFFLTFVNSSASAVTGERQAVIRACRAGCLAMLLSGLMTKSTPDLELLFFAMAGIAIGLLPSNRERAERALEAEAANLAARLDNQYKDR